MPEYRHAGCGWPNGAVTGGNGRILMLPSLVVPPPSTAPFCPHICLIRRRRTKPEVPALFILNAVDNVHADGVVSHARRIITGGAIVTDVLPSCRPVARRQEPRRLRHRGRRLNPVRSDCQDHPITELMMSAGCQPARIGLDYARPETVGQGREWCHLRNMTVSADQRAILDDSTRAEASWATAKQADTRGTLSRHRDLPLVRNRGARPRLLAQVRGLFVLRIIP